MIGEILKKGDIVVVNIPDENWIGGYRPVKNQNGTKAKVKGFGEIDYPRIQSFGRKPGIYTNYAWVELEGIAGSISSCFVELANKTEAKRRMKTWNSEKFRAKEKMIRPLPDLKFWEGDVVKMDWTGMRGPDWEEIQIARIEYGYLGQKRNDGSPMPEYSICAVGHEGCTCAINESRLTLVRRGNVWKHFNGKKVDFKDLAEEASFAKMLGLEKQIRNPATGLYTWTLKEMLNAIRDGKVDGFTADHGIFGTSKEVMHWAYRFKDRNLGERVRQATLEGFLQNLVEFDRQDYEEKFAKGLCEKRGCNRKATWSVCATNGRGASRCGFHKSGKGLTFEMRKIKG